MWLAAMPSPSTNECMFDWLPHCKKSRHCSRETAAQNTEGTFEKLKPAARLLP